MTAGAGQRASAQDWLAVFAGALGALIATLDISIVNSALPQIQGEIGATGTEGTWIATGYLVSEVVMIPLSAWLSRLLGMRTLLLGCSSMFTLFSVLCGFSNSLTVMIIGRVGQGFFGAAKAGVTPPSLQYYFDSKEGLHRACAQYIIDRALPRLQPHIASANAAALQGGGGSALPALEKLLDSLTDSLAIPGAESWNRFIVRGKHDGAGPGMEMIREQISVPTLNAVAGLLEALTGSAASSDVTRLRTLLILGQIHWMHAGREQALKFMGWNKFDAAKLALVKQMIRDHTRLVLKSFAPPAMAAV